jgi:hypothetical protein
MENNYTQLCVLLGISDSEEDLMKHMKKEFKVRFKFAEFITIADGRRDALFYVHSDDIQKFAVARFALRIKWWEDAVANKLTKGYPRGYQKKYPKTW